MSRYCFPPSTTGRYLPGIGTTITQANIAIEQARRQEAKEKPATPTDIVALFVHRTRRWESPIPPKGRHLDRAYRLMHGGQ